MLHYKDREYILIQSKHGTLDNGQAYIQVSSKNVGLYVSVSL